MEVTARDVARAAANKFLVVGRLLLATLRASRVERAAVLEALRECTKAYVMMRKFGGKHGTGRR